MARKAQELKLAMIAEEAGVSYATVSRVINCKPGVGEETRKRITALLRAYGFTPNYPQVTTTKIAVLFPWMQLSPYFSKAMDGIYSYAFEHGLMVNLIITSSLHKESLLESIRQQQCSGVIALFSEHYMEQLQQLEDTDLPVAVLDNTLPNSRFSCIDNDSFAGSYAATKYLIDLGHQRIGYLAYAHFALNHHQRMQGYASALRDNGIPYREELIRQIGPNHACFTTPAQKNPADTLGVEQQRRKHTRGLAGYIAMKEFLDCKLGATAVMAVDDDIALGAICALRQQGLQVPQDLSVIGFDNYSETAFWNPPLTTVDHPVERAGYRAMQAIHSQLNLLEERAVLREVLSTSLVIRESCCPPKT